MSIIVRFLKLSTLFGTLDNRFPFNFRSASWTLHTFGKFISCIGIGDFVGEPIKSPVLLDFVKSSGISLEVDLRIKVESEWSIERLQINDIFINIFFVF
jgi:hypothetical protein